MSGDPLKGLVCWGKTDGLKLYHDPRERRCMLVERFTQRLLCNVAGHPADLEVHDQFARRLDAIGASASVQRDLLLLRRAGEAWRPAA